MEVPVTARHHRVLLPPCSVSSLNPWCRFTTPWFTTTCWPLPRRSRFRFTNRLRSDAPARRPPRASSNPNLHLHLHHTAKRELYSQRPETRKKTLGWVPVYYSPLQAGTSSFYLLLQQLHTPASERRTATDHHHRHESAMQPPHRHAKTNSEVTSSMAASSPPRAPYYVQSPSHDDGENKTTASSFHSSPAASPPRSRDSSSSSRFSASKAAAGRRGGGPWVKEAAIEEEGLLMDDDDGSGSGGGIPRRWKYGLGFVGAFFALFFFFALILWGASHNQKPVVHMQSVTFHKFVVQAGTDASLVPTEMSTLNATVKLTFRNTGSFFGVHVTAQPVTLNYYQLVLASGNVKYFYQARKSQRSLKVAVVGDKVPLYGGGSGLSSTPTTLPPPKKKMPPVVVPPPPVHLKLAVRLRSRAFVLGRLVKPKFYTEVHCSVTMDQTKMGKAVSLKNKACTYAD